MRNDVIIGIGKDKIKDIVEMELWIYKTMIEVSPDAKTLDGEALDICISVDTKVYIVDKPSIFTSPVLDTKT